MFTMIASNDFPTSRLPILCSRLHTWAPPSVASQNKVAIFSGFDVNDCGSTGSTGEVSATTLAAIDACWMVVRMEGANPPATSVPRPTCERIQVQVRNGCNEVHEARETNLNFPVQHSSDFGHPTGQVKIAGWAVTYPRIPFLYKL